MIDTPLPLSSIDHVFTGVGAYEIGFAFAYGDTIDPARLRSSIRHPFEYLMVTQMDTVKISQGQHGKRIKFLQIVNSIYNFHSCFKSDLGNKQKIKNFDIENKY